MIQQPIGLLHPLTREFIVRYRAKKKRPYSSYICLCEVIEILQGTTAHHKESILYGTYNHTIEFKELMIGYDGDSMLGICIYYLEQYVKDRVAKTSLIS